VNGPVGYKIKDIQIASKESIYSSQSISAVLIIIDCLLNGLGFPLFIFGVLLVLSRWSILLLDEEVNIHVFHLGLLEVHHFDDLLPEHFDWT